LDKSKPIGAKIFSLDTDSLWIEALVPGTEDVSAADPITFQASSIDHVRGLGPKVSVITLKSGTDITVRLPQADLMERLRGAEGSLLDLKDFCSIEPRGKLIARLQADFRQEAEDARWAPLEKMKFCAWVRAPNATDFREINFSGKDVRMREIAEGDSILGGKNIRLSMRNPLQAPFDGLEFIMEGTIAEFRAMTEDAHARGKTELDLRDYTSRKGFKRPASEKGPRP
jgi:hypothetical protein